MHELFIQNKAIMAKVEAIETKVDAVQTDLVGMMTDIDDKMAEQQSAIIRKIKGVGSSLTADQIAALDAA